VILLLGILFSTKPGLFEKTVSVVLTVIVAVASVAIVVVILRLIFRNPRG